MDSLQHALRLNNEGVSLMIANKDRQAVQMLGHSLNHLKHVLRNPTLDADDIIDPVGGGVVVHDATYPYPLTPDFGGDNSSCCLDFYIYSNAVTLVVPLNDDSPPPSAGNINCYSAVIILNIALIYHRQGLHGNPASFVRARKMYEMASHVIGCDDKNATSWSNYYQGTGLLVKLAAVNNLSLILREDPIALFESSQEGFLCLASLLGPLATLPDGDTNSTTPSVNVEDIRGMVLNIYSSTLSSPTARAA